MLKITRQFLFKSFVADLTMAARGMAMRTSHTKAGHFDVSKQFTKLSKSANFRSTCLQGQHLSRQQSGRGTLSLLQLQLQVLMLPLLKAADHRIKVLS